MSLDNWQSTPFTLPFLLIGLLCAWTAYAGWRRRSVPEAGPFAVLMAAIAGWTLLNLVEKSLVDHELRFFVSTLVYGFIVVTPAAWLVYALVFSRQDRRCSRRTILLLFIEPVIVLALAFTDSHHGLLRAATHMRVDGDYAVMVVAYGPLFWLHVAYTYSLFVAGAALVVRGVVRRNRPVAELLLVLAGMAVPALGNAAYVFHLQPQSWGDLTPAYFAVTGLGAAWLLFHVRIFDVLPLARDFVLDSLHDPVIVIDQRRRILDLNCAARALLPDSSAPVRKLRLAHVFPELAADLPSSVVDSVTAEICLRRGDKDQFWEMHVRPMVDHGAVLGLLIRLSDITARRQAEEALLQSWNQYRNLATLAPVGIFQADRAGDCVYVNEKWCQIAGMTQEAARGKGWIKHLHPEDCQRVCARWDDAVRAGAPLHMEFRFQRPDGSSIFVLGQAIPESDSSGSIAGYLGTITDITERKQAEADRARLLNQEQAARGEAERLLSERRLADQRKDEFLAVLGHELRNPLLPLRNAADILRLQGSDPRAVASVRALIEHQLDHLARLVDDLLDIARITQGKFQLHKERVAIPDIVARAVTTSQFVLDARRHSLEVRLPESPLWVQADPVRLVQVLANLLHNAAKYTEPAGRVWLTVEREGSEVVLRVGDTGIGIPAHMLSSIFDLFTQADSAAGRAQGGLGIGLTLVRRLVEMHGGSVQAFSAGINQGSEFVVRLPVFTGAAAEPVSASGDAGPPKRSPARRVLLGDDDRVVALSLEWLLRTEGHEVLVCHDGASVLAAAPTFQPEIVLLDIGLPGMDGYEVARRLRQQPSGQSLLLIALTGYGREEDRRRSRQAGFDHHLVKPVDYESLRSLLVSSVPA
jgi:two-component system CheB/CheR fusion protein